MLFLLALLALDLLRKESSINKLNSLIFKNLLELLGFQLTMEGKKSFCHINHDIWQNSLSFLYLYSYLFYFIVFKDSF